VKADDGRGGVFLGMLAEGWRGVESSCSRGLSMVLKRSKGERETSVVVNRWLDI